MKKFLATIILLFAHTMMPVHAAADARTILIDTTALAGTDVTLAFELIDGGPPSNDVTLSDFATDATLGGFSQLGHVSGTLDTSLAFFDTYFFTLHAQSATLGTSMSFKLVDSASAPPDTSFPDSFSFFLLDTSNRSLVTTSDPTGSNALFNLSMGSPNGLSLYSGPGFSVSASPVPEPVGTVLYGAGMALIGLMILRKKWRCLTLATMLCGAGAHAADLTGAVQIARGGLVFNISTDTYDSVTTITNTSGNVLFAPLRLIVTTTPVLNALDNRSGTTADGKPYIEIVTPNGLFSAGETISTVLKFRLNRIKFSAALAFDAQTSPFDPYLPKTLAGRFASISSCGPSGRPGTVRITPTGEFTGFGCYAPVQFGLYRSTYEYLYATVASSTNGAFGFLKDFRATNLHVSDNDERRLFVRAGFTPATAPGAGATYTADMLDLDPTVRLKGWLAHLSNRPCSARFQSQLPVPGTIELTATDINIRSGNAILQSIPVAILLNGPQFSYHELLRPNDTMLVTGTHVGDLRDYSVTINLVNPSSASVQFEFALVKPDASGQRTLGRCNT